MTIDNYAQSQGAHVGFPVDFEMSADEAKVGKKVRKTARPGRDLIELFSKSGNFLFFYLRPSAPSADKNEGENQ